jgi:hypothetical protein
MEMAWNYSISVPGSGRGRLAAVSVTAITGRLLIPALRQLLPAPVTRRRLAEEPPVYAAGRGQLP